MASIIKSDTKAKAIQKAAQKKVAARKPVPKKKPVVTKPQATKQRGTSDGGTGEKKKLAPIKKQNIYTPDLSNPFVAPPKTADGKLQPIVAGSTAEMEAQKRQSQITTDRNAALVNKVTSATPTATSISDPKSQYLGTALNPMPQTPPLNPTVPSAKPATGLEDAENRYADRPDLTPEQKYNFKIQEDQEVKQTTEDTVKKVDDAVGGATTNKSTKPTTTKTSSGKPATTTPGGTGTTSIPEEPKPPVQGEPPSTDNPYADQLKDMKFEYDPFSDPEYRETAANLENQVAQMMIGRGGLYSSVASSALSAKLISLQNDMEVRAYDRFRQDRDFTLQMAKFTEDQINTAWQQAFQEKQFAFTIEKEKFDQKMALANYNLSAQAQAFSQKMQTKSYNLSVARYNADRREAEARQQLGQQQLLVEGNALVAAKEREKFNTLKNRWLETGKADDAVRAYFGVPPNASPSAFGIKIVNRDKYLTQTESQIASDALNLGMNKAYLDNLVSMGSTQWYVPPVAEKKEPAKVTRKYDYDEDGNRTGYSETISGSNVQSTGSQYKPMDYGYSDK